MVDPLSPEDVEKFLWKNPEFVKNWISRKHAVDTSDEKVVVPSSTHSFINHVEKILSRNNSFKVNKKTKLTESETYREVIKELAFELNEDKLCYAILQNACILLQCNSANIFMSRGTGNNRYLISKYTDVTATSERNEKLLTGKNVVRIPFGKGILGYVAETKRSLNIKDVSQTHQYSISDTISIAPYIKSILCMPILNKNGKVMGVAQVQNCEANATFSSEDEALFENFLSFCGIGIDNAHLFQVCFEEYKCHQLLLKLTKCILKEQNNLPRLISQILQHAMEMLDCSNISVYLIDSHKEIGGPKINSKVFQLLRGDEEVKEVTIDTKYIKPVENNLKSENVFDIFDLKGFSDNLSPDHNDIESWLLCMSIKDSNVNAIGSIMFVRDSVDIFSENDIKMMKTFASFCGLSIFNCRLYETSVKLLSQAEIINDVIAYHTTCSLKTIVRYSSMNMKSSEYYQIYSFDFDDSIYSDDDTVLICMKLFLKLDVVNVLNISLTHLFRFILTVKKNYRPVTYHNWRHCLNVTQSMFCMLTTGRLRTYFTKFQLICLIIACMFHDLDHRGQTNSFQMKVASSLATLYSTSVLEHHHIDRGMMILNTAGTNIFENLPAEKYQQGLRLIEEAIIATDLMNHFGKRSIFKHELESGHKKFDSPESKDLLMSMMMTASDLSSVTKPWEIQRKAAIRVVAEYFEQGDLEKDLKCEVLPLMDREKRYEIPKIQVGFIDFVCIPVYKLLVELEACLRPLYDGCITNRTHWCLIITGKEKFNIDEELIIASNKRLSFNQPKQQQTLQSKSMNIKRRSIRNLDPILDKFRSPLTLNLIEEHNPSPWSQPQPLYRAPSFVPKLKKLNKLKPQISVCSWREKIVKLTMNLPHKKIGTNNKSSQTETLIVKSGTVKIYNHDDKIASEDPTTVNQYKRIESNFNVPIKTANTSATYSNINKSATNKHWNIENNGIKFRRDAENSVSSHRSYYPALALSPTSLETSLDIKTLMKNSDSTRPFHCVDQVVLGNICRVNEKSNRKIGQNFAESDSISTVNEYSEVNTVEYDFRPNTNQFRRRKCLKKIPINMKGEQGDILKSYLCIIS